jgi:hypothetical protein
MSISIFPASTGPLSEAAGSLAERTQMNIHQASAELKALEDDPETLPDHLKQARKEIATADAAHERAQAKFRAQLQLGQRYQSMLNVVSELAGEVALCEVAVGEYEATLKADFSNWPFLVRQNGRFGAVAREFALQRVTAQTILPLLQDWTTTAKDRLAQMESAAEKFRVQNRLEKPQNNSSHD